MHYNNGANIYLISKQQNLCKVAESIGYYLNGSSFRERPHPATCWSFATL